MVYYTRVYNKPHFRDVLLMLLNRHDRQYIVADKLQVEVMTLSNWIKQFDIKRTEDNKWI